MDKAKAFILGMLAMAVLAGAAWTSNEAYHEDIRAKANIAKHKTMNWYGVRPDQINK